MEWTTEKPITEGLYWMRKPAPQQYIFDVRLLEVIPSLDTFAFVVENEDDKEVCTLDEMLKENPEVQWFGPVQSQG